MQDQSHYQHPQALAGHGAYDPEIRDSGVMWAAIIGGALTTLVFSFLLFSLAAALGFAALSPWESSREIGKTFAISSALALIVIQWLSAAFGGYLTGRMRTQWIGAHTHEVFFRDTVHGFLSWALAVFLGVLLFAGAAHMHQTISRDEMGSGNYQASWQSTGHSSLAPYFINRLFRTSRSGGAPLSEQDQASAEQALESEAMNSDTSSDDKAFLTQLVAARTGLSDVNAGKRVEDTIAEEKTAVHRVEQYAALSSLFIFFSMMIGAFIASVAGGLGGQHRDLHYATGRLSD